MENNNEIMMGRLARMMRDGDRAMLERFEDLMTNREEKIKAKIGRQIARIENMISDREGKMEIKIGKQLNNLEEIITDKITSVIKEEDEQWI